VEAYRNPRAEGTCTSLEAYQEACHKHSNRPNPSAQVAAFVEAAYLAAAQDEDEEQDEGSP